MKYPDLEEKFERNTLGSHFQMSRAVFGEQSEATKWLIKKAKESPNHFQEKVVVDESQVASLLGEMHIKGTKK